MAGAGNIRFSELFTDTISTHGVVWSYYTYTRKGMQDWEFGFWFQTWAGRAWEGIEYYS